MCRTLLSSDTIRKMLSPYWKNLDVRALPVIDSTNTEARRLLSQETKPYLVAASAQTAGRGRRGRTFYSPGGGCGLYFSLALPWSHDAVPTQVTTMAAVAVCRALETLYDLHPGIKWVNDIFLNGRKVSGILTESRISPETQQIDALIVGIGINLARPQEGYPEAIAGVAGALRDGPQAHDNDLSSGQRSEAVDPNRLCAAIVNALGELIDALPSRAYMVEYRRRCFILGKKVLLDDGRVVVPTDISDDGALVFRENGQDEERTVGEIMSIHLDPDSRVRREKEGR